MAACASSIDSFTASSDEPLSEEECKTAQEYLICYAKYDCNGSDGQRTIETFCTEGGCSAEQCSGEYDAGATATLSLLALLLSASAILL